MDSVPVGVQCPLTSSLSEFPGYWDWLWFPGLSPVLVSIAFPLRLPYLGVFQFILLHLPLDFNRISCLRPTYLHPSVDPSLTHYLGNFLGSGLALVPDDVVPEAEQRCAWSRNLVSNFCPSRGLNRGPCSLMAANVTTRLRRPAPIPLLHSHNWQFLKLVQR